MLVSAGSAGVAVPDEPDRTKVHETYSSAPRKRVPQGEVKHKGVLRPRDYGKNQNTVTARNIGTLMQAIT